MNAGLHDLRDVSDTPRQRVWAAPLWQNLAFVALLAIMIGAATFVWRFPEEGMDQPDSPWRTVFQWTGVIIFVVLAGLSGLRAIHRGRLVLKRDEQSLCFYYLLLWPRAGRQLRLHDIAGLEVREVATRGDAENDPWTYRIVVAELRDGRLASIAFDSTPSIAAAIRGTTSP